MKSSFLEIKSQVHLIIINIVTRHHSMIFLNGIKDFVLLFSTKVLKSTLSTFFKCKSNQTILVKTKLKY
jgi:hypothetical protein